jgi:hypothetical protein
VMTAGTVSVYVRNPGGTYSNQMPSVSNTVDFTVQ